MALPPKDPDANLPYGIKWADWLLHEGTTIESFEWTVPEGLEKGDEYLEDGVSKGVSPGTTVEDSVTIVWLSGGIDKSKYLCTCRISTPDGKRDERSILVYVNQR